MVSPLTEKTLPICLRTRERCTSTWNTRLTRPKSSLTVSGGLVPSNLTFYSTFGLKNGCNAGANTHTHRQTDRLSIIFYPNACTRRYTHAGTHTQVRTRRYAHTGTHTHAGTQTHTKKNAGTQPQVRTRRYAHTGTHTHAGTQTHTKKNAGTHTQVRTRRRTQKKMQVHTRRYTHAGTHTQVRTRRHADVGTQTHTKKTQVHTRRHADAGTQTHTQKKTHDPGRAPNCYDPPRWCPGGRGGATINIKPGV
ncbi:unnamed protein product [Gadus morhua 'NCC']